MQEVWKSIYCWQSIWYWKFEAAFEGMSKKRHNGCWAAYTWPKCNELPFQFVEYVGIRTIFSYLCVDVPNISRNTAKNDMVKMYKREKERMKSVLTSVPSRFCLTSDLWISISTDGYMCVTAHFIDANWVLQKRVLNFCFMPPPHNGVSLFEKVYKLLSMWGLRIRFFV